MIKLKKKDVTRRVKRGFTYWTTQATLSLACSDNKFNVKGEFSFKGKHYLPSFMNERGKVIGHPRSFDYIVTDILVEAMMGSNGPRNGETISLGCDPILDEKGKKTKHYCIIGDKDYVKHFSFLMYRDKKS